MTEIEGIKAAHVQITPNCRKLKGDAQAAQDASDEIKHELLVMMAFVNNEQADFHIVLSVKRP